MNDLLILIQNNEKFNIIKRYIEDKKLDLNQKTDNYSIMEYAIIQNNIELVKYLISKNIKLNIITNEGYTLLFYPIKYNYKKIFDILLNICDINLIDNNGFQAIHYSIIYHYDYAFDILLTKLNDVTTILDNDNNNLLMSSTIFLYDHGLDVLLNNYTFDITYKNIDNDTITHLITLIDQKKFNTTKHILTLLNKYKNIDLTQINNKTNNIPLFNIVRNNNIDILKKINHILVNINFLVQNILGNTLLHITTYKDFNSIPTLMYLINKYPNKFKQQKFNRSYILPLHTILWYLLHSRYDKLQNDYETNSDLYQYISFLIKNTDLNFKNLKYYTPFDVLIIKSYFIYFSNFLITKKIFLSKKLLNSINTIQYKDDFIKLITNNYIYHLKKDKTYKNIIKKYKTDKKLYNHFYNLFNNSLYNNLNIIHFYFKKSTFYIFKSDKVKITYDIDHKLYFIFINKLLCSLRDKNITNQTNKIIAPKTIIFNVMNGNIKIQYMNNETIDYLLTSQFKFPMIYVLLYNSITYNYHSNILIYNKKTNVISRFDPFPSNIGEYNDIVDNKLSDFFNSYNIKYNPIDNNIGVNSLLLVQHTFSCMSLCVLYYIYYVLNKKNKNVYNNFINYIMFNIEVIDNFNNYVCYNMQHIILQNFNSKNYNDILLKLQETPNKFYNLCDKYEINPLPEKISIDTQYV